MSNQVAMIDDSQIVSALQSGDLNEAWQAYKNYNGIYFAKPQDEKEALFLMRANRLNPLKKECYLVPMAGKNTLVVAYQTLLKRAYEAGYDSKDVTYQMRTIESFKPNSTGTQFTKVEDLECKATMKTKDGREFTFVGNFSQYAQKKADGNLTRMWQDKPVLMLQKCVLSGLFRTLPEAGLQAMPYTQDEMNAEHVDATVTSIESEQSLFMDAVSKYCSNVSDLQMKHELTSEEAERWTESFYECGDLECLRQKGQELAQYLKDKKERGASLDNALNLDINQSNSNKGFRYENGEE